MILQHTINLSRRSRSDDLKDTNSGTVSIDTCPRPLPTLLVSLDLSSSSFLPIDSRAAGQRPETAAATEVAADAWGRTPGDHLTRRHLSSRNGERNWRACSPGSSALGASGDPGRGMRRRVA
jgi:hypothetical protein